MSWTRDVAENTMYELFFDSCSPDALKLEIQAWIETLSHFERPLPGHLDYAPGVRIAIRDGIEYLRKIANTTPIDKHLIPELRQHIEDLLKDLGGIAEAVYVGFTVKRSQLGLRDLALEATELNQSELSRDEKETIRRSLVELSRSHQDKLKTLKENLSHDETMETDGPSA